MSDDFRTRIAAALFDAADAGTWRIAEMNREDAALLADAVIAELGRAYESTLQSTTFAAASFTEHVVDHVDSGRRESTCHFCFPQRDPRSANE